jgi:hypothetical protein
VRSAPPSIHAFDTALITCCFVPPSICVTTAVEAMRTSST